MKTIKIFIRIFIYYFIGNILFNLMLSITEVTITKYLSLHIGFIESYLKNTNYSFTFYNILFFMIIIVFYGINIYLVNELNKKLKRGVKVEK